MNALGVLPLLLLTGCGVGLGIPPVDDSAVVRVYTRGGDGSVTYIFASEQTGATGLVTADPQATCFSVGAAWQLDVWERAANDVGMARGTISSEEAGGSPVDVSISRAADGTVTIIEGVPDWWEADEHPCGIDP